MCLKHYSYQTEKSYINWIKRCIIFHNKRHPQEMGGRGIEREGWRGLLAISNRVVEEFLTQFSGRRKCSCVYPESSFNCDFPIS
ncbi:MAG: hypothetical protein GVY17_10440 [Cyanobacteria bacterium]|nr:hypothetical protein [Cyanobacteria bacterium GSL.Bin21]